MTEHPEPTSPPASSGSRMRERRRLLILALIGVAMVGMALGVRTLTMPSRGEDQVDWGSDYATGTATAAATGKPMLLFFAADWCGACEQLRTYVLSQQRVADVVERDFVPVHVDMTDPNATQQRLAQTYEAYQIPLLVVTDAEGTTLARHMGTLPADDLLQWLAEVRGQQPAQGAAPEPTP